MVVCASLTAGGKHRAFRRRQLLSVTIHCCCCCCCCWFRCRLNNATLLVSSTASLLLIRQPSDSKILTTLTPILVENFYASADNSYEPLEVLWFQFNSTQLTQDNSRRNEKLKNENYYFKNRIPLSNGPWVINLVTTLSLSSNNAHDSTVSIVVLRTQCHNDRDFAKKDVYQFANHYMKRCHIVRHNKFRSSTLSVRPSLCAYVHDRQWSEITLILRWFLLMIAILKYFIELLCPRRATNYKLI